MRSVVYEERFERELAAISADFERADDLLRGIEWVLSRNPEFGDRLSPDADIWAIAIPDVFSLPFVIYYTFSKTHVFMLSIHLELSARLDQQGDGDV
jgi:hypothetical protein